MDNGKQSDHTPYTNATRNAARGKLLAIVQSTNKSGEFTVTAKASGLDAGSKTVKTTADTDVPAEDNSIVSLEYSKNYYVKIGNQPELPTQLQVNYGEDRHEMKNVEWNTEQLDVNNEGISKVNGVLDLGDNKSLGVSVNVMMMRDVAALKNYSAAVRAGSTTANLPQVVPAVLRNGEISEASFGVDWDESNLDLNTPGTYVVSGTAQVFGQEMHPTATIRVSKGEVNLGGNVAPSARTVEHEAAGVQKAGDLKGILCDGKKSATDTAWTGNGAIRFGYDTAQNMTQVKLYLKGNVDASKIHVKWAPDTGAIRFGYDTAQNMTQVKLYLKGNVDASKIHVKWAPDTSSWQDIKGELEETKDGDLTVLTYSFDMVSAESMKLEFEEQVQLIESELYVGIPSFSVGSTDKLESLKVREREASQGVLDNYAFNVPEYDVTEEDVTAVGKDNASVTILPLDSNVIRVLTESEDHSKNGVYTIQTGSNNGNAPGADDDSKDYDYRKTTATAPSWNAPAGSDHSKNGVYTIQTGSNNGNAPGADDDSKDYDYRKTTATAPSWNAPAGSDGPADYAVNGNEEDWWHSRYGEGEGNTNLSQYPEERYIQLDLENQTYLNALRYLPRKGPARNGNITKYRVEVSMDGWDWTPVSSGTWADDGNWKLAVFDNAMMAQHVRLYGEETNPGNQFMTAAEIRVCVADIEGVDDSVRSYEPIEVRTDVGQKPEMPKTVKANMSTGQVKTVDVVWDEISQEQYNHVNKFTVRGTVAGEALKPKATVVVYGIQSLDPVYTVSIKGFDPLLPDTVTARFNDGSTQQVAVDWDKVTDQTGTTTITGRVENTTLEAKATIRFVEGTSSDENIALNTSKKNMPLAIGWVGPPNDNPFNATDGNKNFVSDGSKVVWSDWEQGIYHTDQNWMGVILGSGSSVMPKIVDRVSVGFMEEDGGSANKVKLPQDYKIEYYTGPSAFEYDASQNHMVKNWAKSELTDPKNWEEVKYTSSKPSVPSNSDFKKMVDISFDPVATCAIRISLTPQQNQWVGLEEFEVRGLQPDGNLSNKFDVTEITLDGINYLGDFKNNELTISMKSGAVMPVIEAKVTNNAFVDIKQANGVNDTAVIYISAEDGSHTQVYTINFVPEEESYIVRFESNGGSEVAAVTVLESERVREPEKPKRTGYTFDGWYSDAELRNLYDFAAPVYSDLTLYADWSEKYSGSSSSGSSKPGKPKPEKPEKPEEKPEEKPDEKPEEKPSEPEQKPEAPKVDMIPTVPGNPEAIKAYGDVQAHWAQDAVAWAVTNPSEPEQKPEAPKVDMIPTVPGNPEAIKAYGDVQAHWAQDAVAWAVTNKLFAGVSNTQFAPDSAMTRGMLATVLHRLAGQPALGQNQFADIPATNKLFAGVSNTQFAPDSAMTRGMLATVLHRLAGQPALGQNQFADIPADAYYKNAVAWASQLGLVSGIGEGRFAPNSNITREQLAVILYKFAGSPAVSATELTFKDSAAISAWAQNAIAWAVQEGFLSEQLAVILYKFAGSPAVSATELTFKDSAAISAWAQNAIAWAVQEGFLSGMSDGTLTPAGQATRAQVATILMRFEQKNHKAMPSANPVAAGPSI